MDLRGGGEDAYSDRLGVFIQLAHEIGLWQRAYLCRMAYHSKEIIFQAEGALFVEEGRTVRTGSDERRVVAE
jgi:hypothetical protein